MLSLLFATLFVIENNWKEPKRPSTGDQLVKLWNIPIMEYYAFRKRNGEALFVLIWKDLQKYIKCKDKKSTKV